MKISRLAIPVTLAAIVAAAAATTAGTTTSYSPSKVTSSDRGPP